MSVLTQTKTKVSPMVSIGVIVAVAAVATAIVAVSLNLPGGLASVVALPGSAYVCSESNEIANNVDPATISNYSSFVRNNGDLSRVKYFDIYKKSTAKCTKYLSSSYTDVCLVDVCTGTACKQTPVTSCLPTEKNCHLQEAFIKNATSTSPKISNWYYRCPNGCSDGACQNVSVGGISIKRMWFEPDQTNPVLTNLFIEVVKSDGTLVRPEDGYSAKLYFSSHGTGQVARIHCSYRLSITWPLHLFPVSSVYP